MQRIVLTEFRKSDPVTLSAEVVRTLLRTVPSVAVQPADASDTFNLTPSSYVGVARVGEREFEILPKVGIRRLLFLISYALDPVSWREEDVMLDEDIDVVEAVAVGFLRQLDRVFRRGLLQGYRTVEESSTTIRGRLLIAEQLRRHYTLPFPVEIRYDDYSVDTDLHRVIKAAIRRFIAAPLRSNRVRERLRHAWNRLGLVSDVEFRPSTLPTITYDRLNSHYRPVVELARLVLRSFSYELRHGGVTTSAFLVDMNEVFENFIVVALRDALKVSEQEFPQGARGHSLTLDSGDEIRLEPDLSWWQGNRCLFVGDVKYKSLEDGAVNNADIYQVLAYVVATRLPKGLLLYAAPSDFVRRYDVRGLRKQVMIRSLDLMQPPPEILEEIGRIANSIRDFRYEEVAA